MRSHIEAQLKTLLADTDLAVQDTRSKPATDIVLHFSDPNTGADLGTEHSISVSILDIQDFESIPDYVLDQSGEESKKKSSLLLYGLNNKPNRDFYRQSAMHLVTEQFFRPIRFWLKNKGTVGAHDVHIEFEFKTDSKPFTIIPISRIPSSRPTKQTSSFLLSSYTPYASTPSDLEKGTGNSWQVPLDLEALQPQRAISPKVELAIGARQSCEVVISAHIYADTLPEPVVRDLKLRIEVTLVKAEASEVLQALENWATETE